MGKSPVRAVQVCAVAILDPAPNWHALHVCTRRVVIIYYRYAKRDCERFFDPCRTNAAGTSARASPFVVVAVVWRFRRPTAGGSDQWPRRMICLRSVSARVPNRDVTTGDHATTVRAQCRRRVSTSRSEERSKSRLSLSLVPACCAHVRPEKATDDNDKFTPRQYCYQLFKNKISPVPGRGLHGQTSTVLPGFRSLTQTCRLEQYNI